MVKLRATLAAVVVLGAGFGVGYAVRGSDVKIETVTKVVPAPGCGKAMVKGTILVNATLPFIGTDLLGRVADAQESFDVLSAVMDDQVALGEAAQAFQKAADDCE